MKYYTHQQKVLIIVIIVLIIVKLTRYGLYAFLTNNITNKQYVLQYIYSKGYVYVF